MCLQERTFQKVRDCCRSAKQRSYLDWLAGWLVKWMDGLALLLLDGSAGWADWLAGSTG